MINPRVNYHKISFNLVFNIKLNKNIIINNQKGCYPTTYLNIL